jgi:methionyl-tRNA formyltransferase
MKKGADLVLKTVKGIAARNYSSTPQVKGAASKPAPKIFKETCEINWDQPSQHVRNFVRGLSPYPAAWTTIDGKIFKIYKVSVVGGNENKKPGEWITDQKNHLHFKTSDGWISIEELQPEGKRRMMIGDFFRGNKI